MFEIDDEFDVDEDFLEDVFSSENKENPTTNVVVNQHSEIISPRSDVQPGLIQDCLNNFDVRTPETCTKASNFLDAWKSCGNDSLIPQPKPSTGVCPNKTSDLLQVLNPKSSAASSSVTKVAGFPTNVRTRKFPGPAGLLPERQGNSSLIATEEFLLDLESENKNVPLPEEADILSQDSCRNFAGGCWAALLEDLGPTGGEELLGSVNVKSIRNKAKNSRSLKVPFLAVLLQSVDSSTPDPCLSLRDTTGEMHGALHRDVWDRYGEHFVPGCVLVLRNVGVISAGFTSRRHYLNITANNMASIYTIYNSEEVKRININPILRGDISRLVEEWEMLIPTPPPVLSVESPPPPVKLFSSAVNSPGVPPSPSPRYNAQRHPRPQFQRRSVPPFRPNGPPRHFGPPRAQLQPSFRPPASSNAPQPPPRPPPPSRPLATQVTSQPPQHAPKRPRFEARPSGTSIFSARSSQAEEVVESLLEGLDADSLFGDF